MHNPTRRPKWRVYERWDRETSSFCILTIETDPLTYPAVSDGGWVFYEVGRCTLNTVDP
jgi:hypothetical protein